MRRMRRLAPSSTGTIALLRGGWKLGLVVAVGLAAARSAAAAGAAADDGVRAAAAGAETPRELIESFLARTREGHFDEAARLLDPGFPVQRAEETARRLRAVLDRRLWVDLSTLSRMPGGTPDDALPPDVDRLGSVPGPSGPEPVLLRRNAAGRWVIAASSLDRVDAWYERLPDRWLREHLPSWLFRSGPRDLFYWQWLALPLLAVIAWIVARLLMLPVVVVGRRLLKRTAATWDDALLERLRGPLALGLAVLFVYLALPSLLLVAPAESFVQRTLKVIVLVVMFWGGLRAVDVAFSEARHSTWLRTRPQARGVLPFMAKAVKVLIFLVALVTTLQQMGYAITGLIAGLGIGGLAIALAAQKTFENLIGSIALSVDQPFHQGDLVKIDDLSGTIEEIGLRSTRLRTAQRTLVTLPNGKLADSRIENLSARERIRFFTTVGLAYGLAADGVRAVQEDLRKLLAGHPKAFEGSADVRIVQLAASSIDLEATAQFTCEPAEFPALREQLLLEILEIVGRRGAALAFPTQTVHLVTAARESSTAARS